MSHDRIERWIRLVQGAALLTFPVLFIVVFIMHFHNGNALHFRTHYTPAPPERVVGMLIGSRFGRRTVHDPHVFAYLGLPLLPLVAFALYSLGRRERPLSAALALAVTFTGIIFTGGLFGMWTAFYSGISQVDPKYTEGAIATFAALTKPTGAFLLTTTLAKLLMIGLGLQALALWGVPRIPKWAPVVAVVGCSLFLAFWDLDNWMLIGAALLLAAYIPFRRALLEG